MICIRRDCPREAMVSASGFIYDLCEPHVLQVLSDAFGPEPWTERARHRTLPPLALNGAPRPDSPSGAEAPAVSPERPSSLRPRQGAPALAAPAAH